MPGMTNKEAIHIIRRQIDQYREGKKERKKELSI